MVPLVSAGALQPTGLKLLVPELHLVEESPIATQEIRQVLIVSSLDVFLNNAYFLGNNVATTPVLSEGPCKQQLNKLGDNVPPGAFVPHCNKLGEGFN